MTLVYPLLVLLAAASPVTLDQVRAISSPGHRAKAAVVYAAYAERAAENAYNLSEMAQFTMEVKNMVAAMELARDSFQAAGKTPGRQPNTFTDPELRSHEILNRLGDLRHNMDLDQQSMLDGPIMEIQAIHDAWFDGIMGKKK